MIENPFFGKINIMNLKIKIGELSLPNSVTVASGTFGNGEEMAELIDVKKLGGIFLKGTTLHPREGNFPQRIVETPSGLLNSIGLQNPGLEEVLKIKAPFVKQLGIPSIINISGSCSEEYAEMAKIIENCDDVDAIEMNVSCPNVKQGGIAFGTDAKILGDAVKQTRNATRKPLIVKLSPNVTDITEMARVAETNGADALSVINTLVGMVIDTKTRKPVLANKIGGLSGPAIRPVAIKMVWQVAKTVKIPIFGIGGIEKLDDALQFFIAGASAIQIGTANFYNPEVSVKLVDEIENYLKENGLNSVLELRGNF